MEKDTLFSGESVNVEYKVTVPKDSVKYMKTVVAYANGRGQWHVYPLSRYIKAGGRLHAERADFGRPEPIL